MSALGERVAVVSLGLSCQTARQINGHLPELRELTGDQTLEEVSLPFDWLISTVDGLKALLAERKFFPDSHTELVADQNRLRLRAHDILYWHVSRLLARPGYPLFEEIQSKFRHTSSRFEQIAKLDRVIAVFSDTQGNLPWIQDGWNVRLTDSTVEQADDLRNAFAAFLGRPVDLLMVSRNEQPELPSTPSLARYHMVPDEGWAGDGRKWTTVFKDYFALA